VQTNIVVFHLNDDAPEAAAVVAAARERGVLVLAFARRTVRAVTHLDVTTAQCVQAGAVLRAILDGR
jgi:threonine aldolase